MKDSKGKMMETEGEHRRMKEIYREIMETERNKGERWRENEEGDEGRTRKTSS